MVAAPPPEPRTKSLVRSLVPADFLTLGNATCGTVTIFLCLNYLESGYHAPFLMAAFCLLPVAVLLDAADGFVARRQSRSSAYGADLDSLADVVSFGVAPAVLGFTLGMRGVWDSLVLCIFVCCGVARLARYNVTAASLSGGTGKVRYYEGTPIPTSLVLVGVLAIACWLGAIGEDLWFGRVKIGPGYLHPLVIMYLVSGALMVSRVRIPKP